MRSSSDAAAKDPDEGRREPAFQLFIVEFDLADLSSHFFNQVLGFRRAAEERGGTAHVFIGKNADPALAEPLMAHRLIEWTPKDAAAYRYQLDGFAESHAQLQPLWHAIQSMEVSSRDIVMITSARPAVIYSLGAWLSRLAADRRPAVFIRFYHHDYLDLENGGYSAQSWTHRFAARDLSLRPGQERVFFTVNNEALIRPLAQLCSRRVFQMPLPKYYGDIPPPRRADPARIVIYVHLNMRSRAMLDRIEPMIAAILDSYPQAKFLLKYTNNALTPESRLSAMLRARGVELVPAEQSHADHMSTIARSDIVLLPYEATEYAALASGVFAEAAALGKVVVYPDGTWMAAQVADKNAAGVGFAAANQAEVGAAVLHALDSLAELSADACARSHDFRSLHSCRRNLELMLALAPDEHAMSLSYPPESRISFREPFQVRDCLGPGWSLFESAGIWTEGAAADLIFRVALPPAASLDVQLLLTPFYSRRRPQQVTVSVEGIELGRWDLPKGRETWHLVNVPLRLMTNGLVRMRLHIHDPHSPKEIGISDDPRLLGVMLHEMRLSAGQTLKPPSSGNG